MYCKWSWKILRITVTDLHIFKVSCQTHNTIQYRKLDEGALKDTAQGNSFLVWFNLIFHLVKTDV